MDDDHLDELPRIAPSAEFLGRLEADGRAAIAQNRHKHGPNFRLASLAIAASFAVGIWLGGMGLWVNESTATDVYAAIAQDADGYSATFAELGN